MELNILVSNKRFFYVESNNSNNRLYHMFTHGCET